MVETEKRYLDASLTPRERAKDLLSRMTIREKVGQLNQRLYGFRVYEREGSHFSLTEEFCKEVEHFDGLGVLYGLYRADPWADKDETTGITPELSMEAYNTVQRYVIEHSRLGIPMLLSTECPHGHQALGGGLLPVNLAVGASFDTKLLKESYAACGKQLAACGADLALMSVLDVLRDPRWGRSEECYSEDPYLCASMAEAAVTGMQSAGVTAIAKHLCAQGEGTGGVNASAARIGERELREIHLPPVKAVSKAGVGGVMAAYNEIDGIYCHANAWLLKTVLREEFGFDGVVMADGVALDALNTVTGDSVHSGAVALRAGVDISLWDNAFYRLEEALAKGLITEADLDEAVLRVLTLKFERGLFERPYLTENAKTAKEYGIEPLSLQLARESAVLLKNEDALLPLTKKKQRILVTGPNAADLYRQLGDYTPPVKKEDGVTVLEGVRLAAGEEARITFLPGCGLFTGSEEMLAQAVAAAKESDVVIAVLGGSSSRFEGARFDVNGAAVQEENGVLQDCGEGRDVADLVLPEAQRKLVAALAAEKAPVVSVVIGGRPYGLAEIEQSSKALLLAFYPGPYGGQAVGELLFGQTEPSGRLPVSLPKSSGSLPVYYNYKASYKAWNYADEKESVLHSFGEGQSYTCFSYRKLAMRQETDGAWVLSGELENTGSRRGTAVPQLYLHHRTGSVVPRARELKAFARIELEAGECREFALTLSAEALAVWDAQMKHTIESGTADWYLMDMGELLGQGTIEKKA